MDTQPNPKRRAYWLKTLHQWHWISSAVCLLGMLLFSITGITLNHAGRIEARPEVVTRTGTVPPELLVGLSAREDGEAPLPPALAQWLAREWSLRVGTREAEWSGGEIYLSLPRPGGDGWVSIDTASGQATHESTDRGWIAYFNDLHKGRNAGPWWSWFIDLFAVAALVFSLSGLFLLQMHARQRPATWPMVGLGVLLPLLIALLLVH